MQLYVPRCLRKSFACYKEKENNKNMNQESTEGGNHI